MSSKPSKTTTIHDPLLSAAKSRPVGAERSEVPARRETTFMQNKPNLKIDQMAVTKVFTGVYDKRTLGVRGKNKPNSNPKQTQSQKRQK